ncbi:MAG: T9SS type A sorting domain-containing protein [Bacteroidetes bacterium]|nr:T9SS type A sorting domain-containing protein [Bacteroidota bacterium]
MKKLLFQLLLVLGFSNSYSQTIDTLFYERFQTGGGSFTLNTSDEGGVDAATGYNQWVINDAYQGGSGQLICAGIPTTFNIPTTQSQPVGSTGGSSTSYLHISSDAAQASGIFNNSFLAANGFCGGDESYFAAMNQDLTTTGFSTVIISFWWLCGGGSNSFGELYYSSNSGASWTLVNANPTQFNNQPTWVQQQIALPAFAGQNTLRFGFRFVNNVTFNATDPAFGIDEILITAENSVAAPVAAFTVSDSAFCEGMCVNYTDVSSGSPTNWLWIFQGATTAFSTQQNPTNVCYPVPGTYPVTLIVGSAAGTDTITMNAVTVYSNPATPLLTSFGDTLIATPGYISYTWYRDSIFVLGTNNNEYIATQNGTYYVIVTDSNGCFSSSIPVLLNTGIPENSSFDFSIFPNPSSGQLFLNNATNVSAVKIYNPIGEMVWSTFSIAPSGKIDISSLGNGIYSVMIISNKGKLQARKLCCLNNTNLLNTISNKKGRYDCNGL